MTLPLAHLVFLALWGGIVATEGVLELLPRRRPELARATATFHYFIDLLVELPVLVAVVVSGTLLVATSPMSPALWVKVACGVAAVGSNLFCITMVVKRHREAEGQLEARSRLVRLSAAVGMPFAAVALFLGARLAGWFG